MIPQETFYNKYKHFLSLFAFTALLIWFKYLEGNTVPKFIVYSPLDSYIPLIKEFVIPYYVWYIYIAFGVVYLGIVSKRDFYKLYTFLFVGMSLCYAIYTIFPNAQFLRLNIIGKDIFSVILRYTYIFDTPTNVCPSIHVVNTIAVHLSLVNCSRFKNNTPAKVLSRITSVLICASTVFIKQHSIIDVAAAIVLSTILYLAIYEFPAYFSKKISKLKEHQAF